GGVLSADRVPADSQNFHEHPQAIAQGTDTSAFAVRPAHRNFLNLETKSASQEENLRIKTPALDVLQGEDRLNRPAGTCLKTALGVTIVQTENNPQSQIENAAEQLPIERLGLRLQLDAQPARAHRDIGARIDGGEQFVCLF